MPIYEYECPSCGRFEVLERVAEAATGKVIKCKSPGCSNKAKRVLSAPSFHLKGSGWYKTDYANSKTSGSSASESPSAGATESNGSSENTSASKDSTTKDGTSETKSAEAKSAPKKGKCSSTCGCH